MVWISLIGWLKHIKQFFSLEKHFHDLLKAVIVLSCRHSQADLREHFGLDALIALFIQYCCQVHCLYSTLVSIMTAVASKRQFFV